MFAGLSFPLCFPTFTIALLEIQMMVLDDKLFIIYLNNQNHTFFLTRIKMKNVFTYFLLTFELCSPVAMFERNFWRYLVEEICTKHFMSHFYFRKCLAYGYSYLSLSFILTHVYLFIVFILASYFNGKCLISICEQQPHWWIKNCSVNRQTTDWFLYWLVSLFSVNQCWDFIII